MRISSSQNFRPELPDFSSSSPVFREAIDQLITEAKNTGYGLRAELCAKKIYTIVDSYRHIPDEEKRTLIGDLLNQYFRGILQFFVEKEGGSCKKPVDIGLSIGQEVALALHADDLGVWAIPFEILSHGGQPLFTFGTSVCFPDAGLLKEKFKSPIAETDLKRFGPAIDQMLDVMLAAGGSGRNISVARLMFVLADFLNQTSAQKITGIADRGDANVLKNIVTPIWLQALSDAGNHPDAKCRLDREAGFAYLIAGDNLYKEKNDGINHWLARQLDKFPPSF